MEVSHLYIYPIKSLQGIELSEAQVLEKGFKYDRRWMMIDEQNRQLTQRAHPHLSQIKVELKPDIISLSHPNMSPLEVPITSDSGNRVTVTVWEHSMIALEAEEHISEWFSEIAGVACRLVYMPEEASRPANPERSRNGEHVSFADGYPYLIIGQSSLDDLNSRLDSPIPMNRFRPNIVVTGPDAYAEDEWRDFHIGELGFYGTHGCKRCVFTTIDQETGQKGIEPLKTLATYRKEGNEIYFGLNAFAKETGTIRVGDYIDL